MLGNQPIDPILLTTDLTGASREFYSTKLQLEIVSETESEIVYRSGATQLKLSASTTGTNDSQTQASWRVDDVRTVVDWLVSRGISPQEYDSDELTTENGVADQGTAWVAWIVDPDGNTLGIEQAK